LRSEKGVSLKERKTIVNCQLNKADYHVHPNYSKDATGSIEDYCQKALQLGLEEICFTTHYDSDPFRKEIDPFMRVKGKVIPLSKKSVRRYIEDIRGADHKYRPLGLSVKAGLEIDYAPHLEEKLREDLVHFDLDYRLGSVHCLDHIAITASKEAERYFETKSGEQMVSEYFEILQQAVESSLFDVMAHLDIYKKYGLGFYGREILVAHRGLVEPVLKLMKERKVAIEVNTGVLRKGHQEFSPGEEILKAALDMGVQVAAFGSDAHRVEDLGKGIQEAFLTVRKLEKELSKESATIK
jgi:histidinol-phosphatase (PHP family)